MSLIPSLNRPASYLWKQLKEHVLTRTVPHTLVSWRFLLPNQSRAVQLHRKVFLGAWPKLPRWQWGLIALYSEITWLFIFSWWQIYFCMKGEIRKLVDESGISPRQQLLDLLSLSLLHGVPPYYYYYYHLYSKPESGWLDYIFEHELPHWHQVLSPNVSKQTLHLLSDKLAFSEEMASKGISSVETIASLNKGEDIKADRIFVGQSLFFKPKTGSRGDGCYQLSFDSESGNYSLINDKVINEEDNILDELNREVQKHDCLIQPLLDNHPDIAELFGLKLAVVRLVTGIISSEPVPLFASIAMPCENEWNSHWVMDIDLSTGLIISANEDDEEELIKLLSQLKEKPLPFWKAAEDVCLNAHHHFDDLATIGWDVAITSSGIKLLEGNVNWGVAEHQRNVPALRTALIDVYGAS